MNLHLSKFDTYFFVAVTLLGFGILVLWNFIQAEQIDHLERRADYEAMKANNKKL